MPANPVLLDFARACERRFGQNNAQCTDDGAFVLLDDATVHIRLDDGADRVVFWTDLDIPSQASIDMVAHVAMDYVSARYIDAACAMGVNRATGLVTLGRSLDVGVLREDLAFHIIEAIGREAPAALARIETAHSDRAVSERRTIDPGAISI